ncbi:MULTISPECIES: polysaccharide deacetylase family protein [Gracilibacillus]|uniref:Polysaccharide deacetylase n=1 Tax=Gracilibacillus dipsosauri TaxID=178340 RepID=A0A317L5K7_9BACI|nr:polysaccharide deacetylase family protein [Gracilibacillus dipsosauri]PWU70168.1 polysaccharide deacetylase [Gracilibacillus dipsosauri]
MKRKITLIVCCFIGIVCLLFASAYYLMNARSFQIFGGLTNQVETDELVVALTFDDGPTEKVDAILALLDDYQAKATFFLIGKDMKNNPQQTRKIVEAGHQIGNHTFSHERMIFQSQQFIKQEITKTDQLIREAGYQEEIDFRPPFGKKLFGLPYYLSKHDRETITWNIEPDTAEDKLAYVQEKIEPGSIILLHPMYDQSGEELQLLEEILQLLTSQGYSFITVDELQNL